MTPALRFAFRDLRAGFKDGLRGFRIFLMCLTLGVAAIAAIGSVRSAIEAGLSNNGARLLGGQAELEFTYRFANEVEQQWISDNTTRSSEIAEFRSMAVVTNNDGTQDRGLTQIKAVDGAYPLLGTVKLDPPIPLADAFFGQNGLAGIVMDQVLIDRLGLSVGGTLDLGTRTYVLMAALAFEPDNTGGFGLGPRTLMLRDDLEGSSLLAPGTLFSSKYRMMFDPDTDLSTLQEQVQSDFSNSGARWQDARNGAPGVSEFVERLGAFLILVGLSGLAVGGVGIASAVQSFLRKKSDTIATLKTLGATRKTIFATYLFVVGTLTIMGVGLGVVLGALIPIIIAPLLSANLPVPAEVTVYADPLWEAAIYGFLAAFAFTIWPIARANETRAAALFRDSFGSGATALRPGILAVNAVLVAALVGTAAYFSGNITLTLWIAGGIAGALVILLVAAIGIHAGSRKIAKSKLMNGRIGLRLALASIGGPRQETASVVLALGLGLSVLAAVGQIDGNLRKAIQGNLPDIAPSYFFVDIQTNQLPDFRTRLDSDPAVSRVETAPMLRGIITQINGKPAVETAGDHWVLEGDRGLTYAAQPPENTVVTEGTWWPEDYTGPPQISFAAEEAAEMGLNLGDRMTINILGRDIEGAITSFREVDFSTAGIGFILSMNPSALAGAPHSHIATVYAEQEAEAAILRDLASALPNITAIRVRDAIDQVSGVLSSLATATSFGALATLLTGFMVLIGASAASVATRTYEAAILKTLGATRRTMFWSFAIRSALMGAAAGIVALGAGCLGGWAVCRFVLDTSYTLIWGNALAIILGGIFATLFASLLFAASPLSARPAQTLRARV